MAHVTYGGHRPPLAATHPQAPYQQPVPGHYDVDARSGRPAHHPSGYPAPPAGQPPRGPAHGAGYAPHDDGRFRPAAQGYAPFEQPEPRNFTGYGDAYAPMSGYARGAGDADAGAPGMGRLVNLAGAVISVALLLGVGLWSYRLMVRDVSGVPVIQALEGPIRRSPDDPGGRQTPYQQLSVNTVAAQGEAAEAARIVAVAPPPVALTDEDRTIAELQRTQAAPITAPSSPATLAPPAPIPATPSESVTGVAPEPLTLVPASAPGVSRSPLPQRRPGAVTRIAAAAPAPVQQAQPGAVDAQAEAVLQDLVTRLAPSSVTEIDPTTLAPGTRLVQLSVYESAEQARQAWDQLASRFPAYLDGRARIVDSASAGGRTFYRLRAHGFVDEPEARRFCSIFLAQGVDCIPVLTGR